MKASAFASAIVRRTVRLAALTRLSLTPLAAAGIAHAQHYTVTRTSHTILLAGDAHADPRLRNDAA